MKKGKFSKTFLTIVLIQVFAYTWAQLILSAVVEVEINPTTSVAFYAFCGTECGLLTFIKKEKLKRESNNYERFDYSETDEP